MTGAANKHRVMFDARAMLLDMGTLLQANYHKAWKESETGSSRYEKEDFYEEGNDASRIREIVSPKFRPWFWYFSGTIFFVIAVTALGRLLGDSISALGPIQIGTGVVMVGLLSNLIYVYAMNRARTLTRTVGSGKYDPYQKIIPGWGFCRIGIGQEGISVDGGHFLYLVEWREMTGAERLKKGEEDALLILVAPTGYAEKYQLSPDVPELLVPRRFFDAPGGNISWEEFIKLPRVQALLP